MATITPLKHTHIPALTTALLMTIGSDRHLWIADLFSNQTPFESKNRGLFPLLCHHCPQDRH